jgi:MFS family permease
LGLQFPVSSSLNSLESSVVRILLGAIATALIVLLVREARKIPARLVVLMATAFVNVLGMLIVLPLLPFYVKKFGEPGIDVLGLHVGVGLIAGVLLAAFTVTQLLSAPIWGRFSDRFGRRPALLLALGVSACAYLVFGFANSLLVLFLSRLVQGAGGGTVGVIQAYVADVTEPSERARALGWLTAATSLGVALGPVLGALAIALGERDLLPGPATLRMGEAAPGILAAALCLSNMMFTARYLIEARTPHEPHEPDPDVPRRSAWQAARRVISHSGEPSARLIWIYAIAIGSFHGTNTILALFLNARFQVTESTIGYYYMYIGAISVFTRVLWLGKAVDRLGEARLSQVGIVLLASGLLFIPLSRSLPMLAAAVAMIPLGTAFTFPCVTALLSRVTSPTERGLYMGVQQTYGGVSRIVAPLFYGWAFDSLGVPAPFFFCAAFVLATITLGFGLDRYARPSAGPVAT